MTDSPGFEVRLNEPYPAAVAHTRDALKAEGFGILTEIDLRATFREKLDKEFRPFVILGACNPPLAHAAMTADPTVGLLLPCNVTVEAQDDAHSVVRLTDPRVMLSAAPGPMSPAVEAVARDARARMERVREALKGA